MNAELTPHAAPAADAAGRASDDQQAGEQAADKPHSKKIHSVNGGGPTKFDETGSPVYDPEQV